MSLTKADGMEETLNDIQDRISKAQVGDGDEVLNILEDVLSAIGQINMRLFQLERAGVASTRQRTHGS